MMAWRGDRWGRWCAEVGLCRLYCTGNAVMYYTNGRVKRLCHGMRVRTCLYKGQWAVVGRVRYGDGPWVNRAVWAVLELAEAGEGGVSTKLWYVDRDMGADRAYGKVREAVDALRAAGACDKKKLVRWLGYASDILGGIYLEAKIYIEASC
jgi:hypothetical protein